MGEIKKPPMHMTEEMREYYRKCGALGGKTAMSSMTKKERKERAKKAVAARERKRSQSKRGGK